jgi:transposase, IS5 family
MYRKRPKQLTLFENPVGFMGARLEPENRWVKMANLIPWDAMEEKYKDTFENQDFGCPAKPCRMAIGTLIIKEKYGVSDIETVEMIRENPYFQYFIGLPEMQNTAPFDASTITWFRKRLSADIVAEINHLIIDVATHEDPKPPSDAASTGGAGNKGTLILDATCAPADIHFPTDASLLSEAREKLEGMIDQLHALSLGAKPRTYREKARKNFLRLVRSKKPTRKQIRTAIRQQLNYVRRNLDAIEKLIPISPFSLDDRMMQYLRTIRELYRQQREMYDTQTHRVDDRIVSIHQPWVRPIVRGKQTANVEFGAKISIGMCDGYSRIERLDWDAYSEAADLIAAAERHRERMGHYPERILADKIYRNHDNLQYCKLHGIRLNGPKLGRPPQDKALYTEQKRQERDEAGERNAVEGKFGEGKRRYGLGRVMTRLQNTSEVSIHVTFLVMNLEKWMRNILFAFFRTLFERPQVTARWPMECAA